jgi:ABC-type transport system involved in cytochrome bd biosynthesis fused ATPase/permease subunit
LYRKLFDTLRHKAVVSSLHRLHLLTQFDYVYILKGGAIVEEGTFEELKRTSLVFKELWDHQDEKFNVPATASKVPVEFQGNGIDHTLPVSAAV